MYKDIYSRYKRGTSDDTSNKEKYGLEPLFLKV